MDALHGTDQATSGFLLNLFIFFPSSSSSLHKIRKDTMGSCHVLLQNGSMHCSSHLESGHCVFLKGCFKQNSCRELTVTDAASLHKDQKPYQISLCSPVCLLRFPAFILHSILCTLRLKESSATLQQWWSRSLGQVPLLADRIRQANDSISVLKLRYYKNRIMQTSGCSWRHKEHLEILKPEDKGMST